MYRIYGDGRHHLMEAPLPDRLPRTHSDSPQPSRASLGQNSSVCLPLCPSVPLLFSSFCRFSHFVTPSRSLFLSRAVAYRDHLSPFHLPDLPVCSCFHWFALRKPSPCPSVSRPSSFSVLYCSSRYSFILFKLTFHSCLCNISDLHVSDLYFC